MSSRHHPNPHDRISVEVGTHDQFAAHLLICRRGGAIFRQLEPQLTFRRFVATRWAPSRGGGDEKLALYKARGANYHRVLAVAYRPNSNRPYAFAPTGYNHGSHLTFIICNGIWQLVLEGNASSIVLTSLSWRNPEMMDHVLASVLTECRHMAFVKRIRITCVLPERRPELVRLVEEGYSISRRYLKTLERYYSAS